RVRRVAQERHAAAHPLWLADFLDVGTHHAVGRLELVERPPHPRVGDLGEQGAERLHAVERPSAAVPGRVEGRPHVELTAADGDEPNAQAAAEELGEVLEPVHVEHHEAMRPVSQVDGLVRSEEARAYGRSDAVGADQDVAPEHLASVGVDAHAVRSGLQPDDPRIKMDAAGRQAVVQTLVQVRPVTQRSDREAAGRVERTIVSSRQPPAAMVEGVAREVGRAARADTLGQTVGLEHGHGVRIHNDSGADRRELGSALEHDSGKPAAAELAREREPTDSATHDDGREPHQGAILVTPYRTVKSEDESYGSRSATTMREPATARGATDDSAGSTSFDAYDQPNGAAAGRPACA